MCKSSVCEGISKSGNPCKLKSEFFRNEKYWCTFHRPDENCSICYCEITRNKSKVTICKHEFHTSCLRKWLRDHDTCPICREPCMRPVLIKKKKRKRKDTTKPILIEPIKIQVVESDLESDSEIEDFELDLERSY